MIKRHLKRINAPKTWNIQRKSNKFITRPNPGGMDKHLTTSISNILKYDLKLAGNIKEVKHLIKKGEIFVNHKKINDYRYPVCFIDIVSIPATKDNFRLIIDTDGMLKIIPISKEESQLKIIKIIGKSLVKGKTQLNLMDGRNILFEKHHYKVNDSLLVTIPDHVIKEHLSFEKGMLVLLYRGKHIGKIGSVEDVKKNSVTLKTGSEVYETSKEYILIVGKDKPLIKLTR